MIVSRKMVSLNNFKKAGRLSKKELEIMVTIHGYEKESRLDKMKKLLVFCVTNKRTAKQHVEDETEKKLGEFLSALKMITNKFNVAEKRTFKNILKYAPKAREYRRTELFADLLTYVTEHNKAPKDSKFINRKEQNIGRFYIKVKWLYKKNLLNDKENQLLTDIKSYI